MGLIGVTLLSFRGWNVNEKGVQGGDLLDKNRHELISTKGKSQRQRSVLIQILLT